MATEHQRFGKYRLIRRIAAGGMGEVHLAKLTGPSGFEKLVVIKRLLETRRSDTKYVEMFFSEARLAAQLTHSNIVQIFETGEVENVPYIAMEYVHGKSLRKIIDVSVKAHNGPPPPALVAQIVVQLCRGLHFAHEARHLSGAPMGLIHRDINPLNVLISYQGEVKVIDFGIAKSELALDKTQAGTIKGTVVYMSPEQSLGQKLDRRSDLFSVGICLYEALSGKNPFHKGTLGSSLEAIRQAAPPPIDSVRPELAPFSRLLASVLVGQPAQRLANCAAFADALEELIASGALPRPTQALSAMMARLFAKDILDEEVVLERTDLSNINDLQKAMAARGAGTQVLPPRPDEKTPAGIVAAAGSGGDAADASKTSANLELGDVTRESRFPAELAPSTPVSAPSMPPARTPSPLPPMAPWPRAMAEGSSRTQARELASGWVRRLTAGAARSTESLERRWPQLAGLLRWRSLAPGTLAGRFGLPALLAAVVCSGLGATAYWLSKGGGRAGLSSASGPAATTTAPGPQPPAGDGAPGPMPGPTGAVRELLSDSDQGFVATLLPEVGAPSEKAGEGGAGSTAVRVQGEPKEQAEEDGSSESAPPRRAGHRGRRSERLPTARPARSPPSTTVPGASLRLRADPPLAMRHNGEMAQNPIALHAEHGLVEFRSGPGAPGYVIQLRYDIDGTDVSYTVDSTPWADISGAGGLPLGRTPLRIEHAGESTLLELTNPHISGSQHLTLRLQLATPKN